MNVRPMNICLSFDLRHAVQSILLCLGVLLLAACGGGGSGGGGSGGGGVPAVDTDRDGVADNVDVDDDGDGLIEIRTAAELAAMRFDLTGASLDLTDDDTENGSSAGCGGGMDNNGDDITVCSGYELDADIDLTGHYNDNWIPVGSCVSSTSCPEAMAFSGTFDGNGHSVSNLTILRTGIHSFDGVGLFGSTRGSDIRNLRLRNVTMTGGATSGGEAWGMLAGEMNGGTVTGVSAEGTINAPDISSVGGLVGSAAGGVITSSSVLSDSIVAEKSVGGLLGSTSSGGNVKPTEIHSSLAIVKSLAAVATSGAVVVGGLGGAVPDIKINSSLAVAGSIDATGSAAGHAGGLAVWQ